MKFTLKRKKVTFRGKRGNNVTNVSSHRMERILNKTYKGYLLQLRSETTTMPEESRLALAPYYHNFLIFLLNPTTAFRPKGHMITRFDSCLGVHQPMCDRTTTLTFKKQRLKGLCTRCRMLALSDLAPVSILLWYY